MARTAPAPFPDTYQHFLDILTESAMVLTHRTLAELQLAGGPESTMPYDTVARTFAVLSGIVRRSIVVSRYIDTLPVPAEEKQGCIPLVLDRVLAHFAKNKVDIETYDAMIDAELDGELDEELELDGDEDEYDRVVNYDPDADVPGRQPCVLVGELCRDFGLVARRVPPAWLEPVPATLTLLATRAATAAIRPPGKPGQVGHLMER